MTKNHYTFGDNPQAARRLELLASVYEAPSRALVERFRPARIDVALDLGAGPGHTTRLVHAATRARRTIGLEASERYLAEARAAAAEGVEFLLEDVTTPSLAVPAAELVFCRFLLTHVADPAAAIRSFRRLLVPGGVLLLQETAALEASHPALERYYQLVGRLQAHYGQKLFIGLELEQLAQGSPFGVEHFVVQRFERSAASMAELHALNLATWRTDPFALEAFEPAELDDLAQSLWAIARGTEPAEPVRLGLGELALRAHDVASKS
jgi:trans-aconitate 2-methyltransferase